MRKTVVVSTLIIAQFLVALNLYPLMPESMAIHWNLYGEADGYGSRFIGLFLVPIIQIILLPVFIVLPSLEPKGGINKFRGDYNWFIVGFVGFMSYVYGLTVAWNLGWRFDFIRVLAPAFGALFYGLGVLMNRAKMNWFFGIRTPWTLSSEEVWNSTHRLGAHLFKASGVLAFAGLLMGGWVSLMIVIAPVMVSGIYLVYYSYSQYQKLMLVNKET